MLSNHQALIWTSRGIKRYKENQRRTGETR